MSGADSGKGILFTSCSNSMILWSLMSICNLGSSPCTLILEKRGTHKTILTICFLFLGHKKRTLFSCQRTHHLRVQRTNLFFLDVSWQKKLRRHALSCEIPFLFCFLYLLSKSVHTDKVTFTCKVIGKMYL